MTTSILTQRHLLGGLPVDTGYVGRHRLAARPSRARRWLRSITRAAGYVRTSLAFGDPFASSDVFVQRAVLALVVLLSLATAAIGVTA